MVGKKKKINFLIYLIIFLFIIAILVIYFARNNPSDQFKEQLAKCLTEKGTVMYGAYGCSHCKEQKEMFGDAFQFINYVECTQQAELCEATGITGYPTWKINNTLYPGSTTLGELQRLAGC
ncbi:hypothetical protein HZA33_00075 [Candidatus Pacearchaeota archaeon]|nr:hypothetical protein [Candidatus Pacearchaeota archaeon]